MGTPDDPPGVIQEPTAESKYQHPDILGPPGYVSAMLTNGWGFLEHNGFYLLCTAVLLYMVWQQLRPHLEAWYASRTALPPVHVDAEEVMRARERQQQRHAALVAEHKQFEKEVRKAVALDQPKPNPKRRSPPPSWRGPDRNTGLNPLLGSSAGPSYRPARRRPMGGSS